MSAGLEGMEVGSNFSYALEQFTASVFCISQMSWEKNLVSKGTSKNRALLYEDYFSKFDFYV